ncbi:MAG: hypothetical protein M3N42_07195 [Cyanobacteriota bacterium]|nr:hypothetical protein [Cyanobacteriota bacterium]
MQCSNCWEGGRKKGEGRRKKEEGRMGKEEGKISYSCIRDFRVVNTGNWEGGIGNWELGIGND